jgi:hypothetical protein
LWAPVCTAMVPSHMAAGGIDTRRASRIFNRVVSIILVVRAANRFAAERSRAVTLQIANCLVVSTGLVGVARAAVWLALRRDWARGRSYRRPYMLRASTTDIATSTPGAVITLNPALLSTWVA